MIGPIVDSGALALGGLLGAWLGKWIPERVRGTLPLIFGVITISLGASLVGKAAYLHVVVLALVLGAAIGELIRAESILERGIRRIMGWFRNQHVEEGFILQYVTLISVMCFGSMGLFGALREGMTGQPDILLTKAVLDLFTGLIFGAVLGGMVSLIALPQFCILALLYLSATALMPLVSEAMLADFTSCGGIIFLATGLRMSGIKVLPVINMLPALFLVLPLTGLWTAFMV